MFASLLDYDMSMIFLTRHSGPPGVGKTFTVEATAEYFELPLYSVRARYEAYEAIRDLADFTRSLQGSWL